MVNSNKKGETQSLPKEGIMLAKCLIESTEMCATNTTLFAIAAPMVWYSSSLLFQHSKSKYTFSTLKEDGRWGAMSRLEASSLPTCHRECQSTGVRNILSFSCRTCFISITKASSSVTEHLFSSSFLSSSKRKSPDTYERKM